MLSWVPKYGLEPILRGDHDAHLRTYAQAIGGLDYPILLRFGQEMNLPGTGWFGPPEPFIAAWRRVRNAFEEAGAHNVSLGLVPVRPRPRHAALRALLPRA